MKSDVKVWEEEIIIPTYGIGKPEKNPMFLEKRVYQGSSGVVYPYPVIEKIYDEKKNKTYKACFLENEYLKIMILPELGGRVQMAYDKIKKRHFIYYNEVIKPALVGLTGPWISGGIEFNWPQHHRPGTFDPVDYCIAENPDGSKTVWCSELERMFRTKGMSGFTLYPGKAYLEVKVKLYNRTPFPQTFLWWANPAVHVNDHYQSVFPPDVHAVFDHGKRDVSSFPVARDTYYKVDYSEGVDISWYKNIPVPTSFMAVNSKYNFVGGFEHDTQGGLMHVANHYISPGKKQWTWGNGDFGKAWDRNLTDSNKPYIELMCGVYTDNQPDFSWLMPYEEKSFEQYFLPYSNIGVVKNATKDAMLNLEIQNGKAVVKVYTTSFYKNATIELKHGRNFLLKHTVDISPSASFETSVLVEENIRQEDLLLSVFDNAGNILVSWQPEDNSAKDLPEPARAAKLPNEISENEQLYLTGLHLEQYRHASYNPTDYYLEALRRDPKDIRNNNAMGLWFLKRGQFKKAEPYFRKAVETLLERNPNPYDGEPLYNLGLALKIQGHFDEAYEAFYKSVWNAAWQDAGYFSLAQIAVTKGKFEEALELINRSLAKSIYNHKSLHLKTVILRKLGRIEEALKLADKSLNIDNFNIGCLFEKYLLLTENKSVEAASVLNAFNCIMRRYVHNYIEYALDYSSARLFAEASQLISEIIKYPEEVYPIVYYLLGYFASCSGNYDEAVSYYTKASSMNPDYCFPNRLEEVLALTDAVKLNPSDSKASYYLGNFWYANHQYSEALNCWEKSVSLDNSFPTAWRNLALIYYNKLNQKEKALVALERAFELDKSDARILMELDQLYKKLGKPHSERLSFLEKYPDLVELRDDLYLERVTLYNQLCSYEKAKEHLLSRKFHPWEGGEGKVTGQYVLCLTELGKKALSEKRFNDAIELFNSALCYPPNLGEGKLIGAQDNDIHFYIGCTYEELGDKLNAVKYFNKASVGISEPAQVFFYNDQPPDKIFYQGLALLKLNKIDEANLRFRKLVEHGEKHKSDEIRIDYFAVSLPDMLIWDDDLNLRNKIHCFYLMGLGYLGFGSKEKAIFYFQKILEMDINHSGAIIHHEMANKLDNQLIQSSKLEAEPKRS
jgi:tetratricopeptide (TPR) repeat protein